MPILGVGEPGMMMGQEPVRIAEAVAYAGVDFFALDDMGHFLLAQRWFAGKAVGLVAFWPINATLPGDLPGHSALILFATALGDGSTDTYFIPLSRGASGGIDDRWIIRSAGEPLVDGLADPAVSAFLLDLIRRGGSVPTVDGGEIVGVPTSALDSLLGDGPPPPPSYRPIEQSNSAVRYGDRLFLKVFRKLAPGINPDFEIGRFLSERTDFKRMPKTAGAIEYRRSGHEPISLAILQEWASSSGTGWDTTLALLDADYARAEAEAETPPSDADSTGAARLGRRTAEMHLALASGGDDPAFAPEPMRPGDLDTIAREAAEQCDQALDALASAFDRLPAGARDEARTVLDGRDRLRRRLDRLSGLASQGKAIRIHGDYHLGQVLRTDGDDFLILDFEGEPAKPLERRRAKQTALKDVVGMLRSFDYAAFAALFRRTEGRPEARQALVSRAIAWRDRESQAFLDAYLDAVQGTDLVPEDAATRTAILDVLTIEKATYELLYELNNRPEWVEIPLRGVAALAQADGGDTGRIGRTNPGSPS